MPHRYDADRTHPSTGLPFVRISWALADTLEAKPGDLLYISDRRSWLGGLHSAHTVLDSISEDGNTETVGIPATIWPSVVKPNRTDQLLRIQRMYAQQQSDSANRQI